jgi:hypothetical protein
MDREDICQLCFVEPVAEVLQDKLDLRSGAGHLAKESWTLALGWRWSWRSSVLLGVRRWVSSGGSGSGLLRRNSWSSWGNGWTRWSASSTTAHGSLLTRHIVYEIGLEVFEKLIWVLLTGNTGIVVQKAYVKVSSSVFYESRCFATEVLVRGIGTIPDWFKGGESVCEAPIGCLTMVR